MNDIYIFYRDEKPIFNIKNWFLSVSYCKGLICIVVSDKEIGINCEIYRSFSDKLINLIFNKKEIDLVIIRNINYIDL